MNILFVIFIIIISLIALLLILALFIKKEYTLERKITINKQKPEVFNYIKFLKNQDNFSKWAMVDPNMQKFYSGIDGTVGFVSAWDSINNKVGKGEQEITKIIDGEKIEYEIRYIKPFEGIAQAAIATEFMFEHQTKVIWSFNSSMKYPRNVMLLLLNMDDLLGRDLQTGLINLKAILEK